eukprot:764883-Hanusia_phi.AAC.4
MIAGSFLSQGTYYSSRGETGGRSGRRSGVGWYLTVLSKPEVVTAVTTRHGPRSSRGWVGHSSPSEGSSDKVPYPSGGGPVSAGGYMSQEVDFRGLVARGRRGSGRGVMFSGIRVQGVGYRLRIGRPFASTKKDCQTIAGNPGAAVTE